MTQSWKMLRAGLIFLVVFFMLSVVGFWYFGKYAWLDAIWMSVVTLSSVGFGERSDLPPSAKIWTILVIMFGMSALTFVLGSFVRFVTEGEITRVLGRRRMTKDIKNLSNHTIVCGFGRIGQELCEQLHRHHVPFLVIESNHEHCDSASAQGYLAVLGNATEDEVISDAGVDRAKTLITTLPNDAENVFITLTARNFNPLLQIIARAEQPSSASKLRQAGANKVVLPTVIGAQKMARMVTRPVSADLMDLVIEQTFLDVEVDEFVVTNQSRLVGVTVRETEANRKHRLLVVGIKKTDGEIVFNPCADYKLSENDTVVVLGNIDDMERFGREYDL
jgi:voltage-gated potassium channel